jgi:release factor glutamine methyltransferase
MGMKVKEVFEKSVQFLRDRNIDSPRLETELLLAFVLKTDRIGIYLKYEAPLGEIEVATLRDLVVRKSKGEPTAYLLGEKYFYGRRFAVGPGVLIPRPETEGIVEDALNEAQKTSLTKSYRIADLGAGSGCIGISLGLSLIGSEIFMIERSEAAIKYAHANIQALVGEKDRQRFKMIPTAVENWHPSEKFNLVVGNPPYIDFEDLDVSPTVKKYEPAEALFAVNSGLGAIESWLDVVVEILAPCGSVYFEIGPKQGTEVKKLFDSKNIFKGIEILTDFNKKDRIVKAVKNG